MQKTRPVIARITLSALLLTGWFASSTGAQGRYEVEAFVGQPFGVGRITFELPQNMLPAPLGIEGVGLDETRGRALYPAFDRPVFGKIVRGILDSDTPLTSGGPVRQQVGGLLRGILDRPPRTTLYFLFRGDEPLDLSLQSSPPVRLRVVPRDNPMAQQRLLQLWWRQYARPAGLFEPKPDYPPVVDNYLSTTLARRLNLRLPEAKQTPLAYEELRRELGLSFGSESLRMAMQQDRILGLNNLAEPADQPLPKPLSPPPLTVPEPAADVPVEPIANRVPAECFYVHFGSFANFLWLQDTLAKWGGDCQNLIALRGLDHGMNGRIEKQLVLKQTVLSRMLGDTVIADVALIGTDTFFREGGSYGLLFHARNNLALSASLIQQRQERMKAGVAREEKIKIADRPVSYLSSPDGTVRSYYVADGDFHFVATSKELVARFLATASGIDALGTSREFRHARTVMPVSRGDTVWLYLSDAFFRNFTGPHYRVEMARRLQAAADIELVQLARLAAEGQSQPGETIEQLKAAALLPPEFGPLPDGSRVVLAGGEIYDSLRGRRGAFLPVSDTPVGNVTPAENSDYAKFAEFYRAKWGRLDPMIAGVKRTPLKDNREQVVVDVLMSPLTPSHYDTLRQWLGPPDAQQLVPTAGDMAAVELVLSNQRVFAGVRNLGRPPAVGTANPHSGVPLPPMVPPPPPAPGAPESPAPNAAESAPAHAPPLQWGGLAQASGLFPDRPGLLPTGRLRDLLIGYIGTTDELGVLSLLNIGIPPESDPAGYASSPLGGWRRQFDRFTVFSFQREVLEEVTPQLRFRQARRPAQVRLYVDDVSQARITPPLNDFLYARTRQTSLSNLRLLQALNQQLHVPPAACQQTAESLLEAKLICPLGGKYVLREGERGEAPHWTSTALGPAEPGGFLAVRAPQGYQSPPLNWFRGLGLDATMNENTISLHAEIIMQMPPKP
jgi:hypothetical protein